METKKKEQNTKAEAETFAATVKGMNRDDQLMPSSGAADTVTAVRVYDNNDSLAGSQSVNLKRQSYNTGLLRFTFPLIEATTE